MEDVAVCVIQILRIAAIEVSTREADDSSEAVADTDGDTLAKQIIPVSVAKSQSFQHVLGDAQFVEVP